MPRVPRRLLRKIERKKMTSARQWDLLVFGRGKKTMKVRLARTHADSTPSQIIDDVTEKSVPVVPV